MAGSERGGGWGGGQSRCHGNYVFSCWVISSGTDAVSNIKRPDQCTLTKKGIVGAKLKTVYTVTQSYTTEQLRSFLFYSVRVFKVPLCTVQERHLFIKSTSQPCNRMTRSPKSKTTSQLQYQVGLDFVQASNVALTSAGVDGT